MGRTIRRISEAVFQGLHFLGATTDKSFQPTSNCRNEAMLKEAAAFSLHIRTLERDLRAMEKQMTGQFANLRDIMITPLPKVYDRLNEDGEVVAREDAAAMGRADDSIGNNVNYARIEEALGHMKSMMDAQVYQPMQNWLKEFKRIQGEMKILEALRLELDSRKRTVAGLDRKLTLQTAKSKRRESGVNGAPLRMFSSARQGGGHESKLEDVIEKTTQQKAKKEEKTGDSQERFCRMEEEVFASLEGLVTWAGRLRDIAAASLLYAQKCLTSAVSAFEAPGSAQQQQQQQQVDGAGSMGQSAPPASVYNASPAAAEKAPKLVSNPSFPRSAGGNNHAYLAHAAKDQYDQASGFDAVLMPMGKTAPSAPAVADVAPRYVQRAPAHPGTYTSNAPYTYGQAAWVQ